MVMIIFANQGLTASQKKSEIRRERHTGEGRYPDVVSANPG
jgi:hypothetical protein